VGLYDAQSQSIELTAEGGRLHGQLHSKGGFPTPETRAQPDPEPFSADFNDPDRILITSGNEKGNRAVFPRDRQGQIEWLRMGRCIHRKGS
jgi:hypothetical protein